MPPVEPFRGVSLGGWLVFESFLTPYLFTLTDCDVNGNFYDVAIGNRQGNATSSGINRNAIKIGNETKNCMPLEAYPVDTWTLTSSFPSKDMARAYLKRHWDTWVTEDDIAKISGAGLTHVKIPMGHWIRGDIREGEPWVDGDWQYFARAVGWCRKYGLKVVADIHTAPGSQNGFDNSGQLLTQRTARHWSTHQERVARSIKAVEDVALAVKDEGMDDVVGGIEILNEVYSDANITTVKDFYDKSFDAIRRYLPNTTVVASDNFDSGQFNGFWTDPHKYSNTLLDTHLYTVFSEKLRAMSPKQHVAFVCGKHYNIEMMKCCWNDGGRSKGLGRIIGEWTASYDMDVAAMINVVFDEISRTGIAPRFDREISPQEKRMLRNYVEAQMVVYEGKVAGETNGWFYWNFKVQGGVFAEWDLLRGVDEGWFPKVDAFIPARERFGDCEDIILRTKDDLSVIHEYPDPKDLPDELIEERYFDDDIVSSHGLSLERHRRAHQIRCALVILSVVMLAFAVVRGNHRLRNRKQRKEYDALPDAEFEVVKTPPPTPSP
mmetsp:Transcript_2133/g.6160  ORF Transcript_2133/g.6160 Transcript_2133/m.6160 type:complete len:548 (+) Transcript_2133:200-1843(+)|eukprot:CAMPEP_0181027452 /NCGR_PEP_ID=MMETSP1070-20121207/4171_1 /TAXON_ID=265543 /ORGANISM="Minutocellus polymorphus, Strain NH13" /LENGTH=547 /DNA_ID=CAMNT_0023104693 /DNA_START=137 /DNA_END=1780 /DNA_ORIENTATION=-